MKTILLLLLLSTAAQAKEVVAWTDTELRFYDACKYYAQANKLRPPCDALVKESQHHLISQERFNSWCGDFQIAKNRANTASKQYFDLTKKNIDVKKCSAQSQGDMSP